MKQIICLLLVFVFIQLQAQDGRKWEQLFNGKNLDGWIVKIKGQMPGEDKLRTFRVENNLLKVNYDQYDNFNDQ